MIVLAFGIQGAPVAKGRPRFSRRGKFTTTYTDEKTVTAENWIRACALKAMQADNWAGALDCPLSLTVEFYLARAKKPKAHLREFPASSPDTDNYIKAVLDGMQLAGVYVDDSRVVEIHARKLYGEPRTVVRLETVGNGSPGSTRINDLNEGSTVESQ